MAINKNIDDSVLSLDKLSSLIASAEIANSTERNELKSEITRAREVLTYGFADVEDEEVSGNKPLTFRQSETVNNRILTYRDLIDKNIKTSIEISKLYAKALKDFVYDLEKLNKAVDADINRGDDFIDIDAIKKSIKDKKAKETNNKNDDKRYTF